MNGKLRVLCVGCCLVALALGCGRGGGNSATDRKSIVIEEPSAGAKASRPGAPPKEGRLPDKFRR